MPDTPTLEHALSRLRDVVANAGDWTYLVGAVPHTVLNIDDIATVLGAYDRLTQARGDHG